MRCPRKVSNILRTPVKFSTNPSGKTLQNCFIHKSSTGSAKRNEQNSYYSPPLVGKSNGKDTITTHFDWKKQKRILLVDRWEDQTATEDTTATLHPAVSYYLSLVAHAVWWEGGKQRRDFLPTSSPGLFPQNMGPTHFLREKPWGRGWLPPFSLPITPWSRRAR